MPDKRSPRSVAGTAAHHVKLRAHFASSPPMHALKVTSSVLASTFAAWRGTKTRPGTRQPEQLLELFEFEACPYCRLVREALSELDIDVLIKPTPKGGQRFRPQVVDAGGKAQFPYLVDPNTGAAMYESADIIDYLYRTYAGRGAPAAWLHGLRVPGSQLATATRGMRGLTARKSRPAAKPLELYSFESSPYSRLVRERLCELELPYVLRNMAKELWKDMGPPQMRTALFPNEPVQGRNRTALLERTGKVQVPYLIDPNTGTELFESADILDYLNTTYAA